jgi:hypothetical protein
MVCYHHPEAIRSILIWRMSPDQWRHSTEAKPCKHEGPPCMPKTTDSEPGRDKQEDFKPRPGSIGAGGAGQPTSATAPDDNVIELGDRGAELLEITELEPENGKYAGKSIDLVNRKISQNPRVTWHWQSVARVLATIPALYDYLCEARNRNIFLIRGAPANIARWRKTLRRRTGREGEDYSERGDHGFLDVPTKMFSLDIDGVDIKWRADPERAIRSVVEKLGETWANTSYVWFLSSTCGFKTRSVKTLNPRTGKEDTEKYFVKIHDTNLRIRLIFITERALSWEEPVALTRIAGATSGYTVDQSISQVVQPNYIRRIKWWKEHDILGRNMQTIGWVQGARDRLPIPEDLKSKAKWTRAQGHNMPVADHPDAISAVRTIGGDDARHGSGHLRLHMMSAILHLLRANPIPEVVSFMDHGMTVTDALQDLINTNHEIISENLAKHGRTWGQVDEYLSEMPEWAVWCLQHPRILTAKTIKLVQAEIKEYVALLGKVVAHDKIIERVRKAFAAAYVAAAEWTARNRTPPPQGREPTPEERVAHAALFALDEHTARMPAEPPDPPPADLIVEPPGSHKSTLMRAYAVRYVDNHPDKNVVILVPRHRLGEEQLAALRKEHPAYRGGAAVWRGRHALNPNVLDKKETMCRRSEEATKVELKILDANHLCKRGRGKNRIECKFLNTCAFQAQNRVEARIWFCAHEMAVHEMPEVFGDVGWVIYDESPLDAFLFGLDALRPVTLELDALNVPLEGGALEYTSLMTARRALYDALDVNTTQTTVAQRSNLKTFIDRTSFPFHSAGEQRRLTWRARKDPKIRPDMTGKELDAALSEAESNPGVKKETVLWELIESYGRITIQADSEGRKIHMRGKARPAKGWDKPTLICDATGDIELLKPVWPQLRQLENNGWQQLPRPANVRIMQGVNKAMAKRMIAIEGDTKRVQSRKQRETAVRQVYAAVLMKALAYGGADVGVITYKSTETWIKENCHVPPYVKLMHWGDLTGTNVLAKVRALFVIGRPLASAEGVVRQSEALFGKHIPGPQRDYVMRRKAGRIPLVPGSKNGNIVAVDMWMHPDPMAERLRRQVTEAGVIQAVERARAGLRTTNEPLDIWLLTDVAVPELGPVEAVLWDALNIGLDGMLLARGVWFSSIADATRAAEGLFIAHGLKESNDRRIP